MEFKGFFADKGARVWQTLDLNQGTLYWGLRAREQQKNDPTLINATIGTAKENGKLMVLPTLVKSFKSLIPDRLFSYADVRGIEGFGKAWKEDTIAMYRDTELIDKAREYTSIPVPVAGGLTGALFTAGFTFFSAGDVILAPKERWGNIDNVFNKHLGLKIISFDQFDSHGKLNVEGLKHQWQKLEDSLLDIPKVGLYLNFPSNPTGYMPSKKEIMEFVNFLKDVKIKSVIIFDDAYEGFTYRFEGVAEEEQPIQHSIFPYFIGIENILPVKCDGVSKRYFSYGARLGCISVGYDEDSKDFDFKECFAKMARSFTSSAPRGMQEVIIDILTSPEKNTAIKNEKQAKMAIMEERFRLMKEGMKTLDDHAVFEPVNFNAGFFGYLKVKEGYEARSIAEKLLANGLGAVAFERVNGIRIAFCSVDKDNIPKVVKVLSEVV
ncbi:MAG: aminotransferase class I/II-fold pyridoxal phosphate-dependent enzyme [Candidatus Hodarchaeales archaeon]|jgi:aspartate/methionine/tyrosine aminotransferase